MKSYCIKTNNVQILDFLQTELKNIKIDGIIVSKRKFKIYNNIIIHYNKSDEKKIILELSFILSKCITKFYEELILKQYINLNYFYFNEVEKIIILKIAIKIIKLQETQFQYKNEILKELIYEYLITTKKIYIDGMINFRIKEYKEILEYVAELAVTNFIKYL